MTDQLHCRALGAETDFETLVISGGDERLRVDGRGHNKYHVDPLQASGVFNRGSCTCSPLTPDGDAAARKLDAAIRAGRLDLVSAQHGQRRRLLSLYDRGAKHAADVFFAPSGSDLCYLPLLFARAAHPGRDILNLVACPEELGSGSILAHQGRYFSGCSQVADQVPDGSLLEGMPAIHYHAFSARAEHGGINDHAALIKREVLGHHRDQVLICNLVIGSKSGIENSLTVIDELRDHDVIWTVDLCQMRTTPKLVDHLLSLGCLLFITGSKFYQAPPFCGAMLVPGEWIARLDELGADAAAGFENLFTRYDFPPSLAGLREGLPRLGNHGLLLRWEAGLYEMEQFDALPGDVASDLIDRWNAHIVEACSRRPEMELIRDSDKTNKSIISFRLRNEHGFLDMQALRRVHAGITTSRESVSGFDKVLIGQPVAYGNGAFIRLALGSYDIRQFAQTGMLLEHDHSLIERLVWLAQRESSEAA